VDVIDFDVPIGAVRSVLDKRLENSGGHLAHKAYIAACPLLEWTNYLFASERTGICDEFLNGMRSSIVEAIFCTSAGLMRMSMFSMRAQIDIGLSWLYFKDHRIEYDKVHRSSQGFVMKGDAMAYLQEYYPGFTNRWNKLMAHMKRSEADPYRLLSAHVHSQSKQTLPSAGSFVDLIASEDISEEAISVQESVSEYLSDVFLSCFGPKWINLPASIVENAKDRVKGPAISIVLS
jgi:hypothetical protein